ncbi:MAG: branched-chain amino acid aminotransferase [Bacteroidia bacterium]|nr:branched-chain amino acid aminotransferase [Bacteroidia bacterium]
MVNLDWGSLPFGYQKTDYNLRCYYRNGKWGEVEISSSEYINIHMAASALHYGQEAFEGLKAYRGKDGKVRLFRWDENAKRMQRSAEALKMAVPSMELFHEMITKAVKLNDRYIPPYGTGASLYIRPLLYGSGPEVGVKPASEYLLVVFVSPVGPYFKGGVTPVKIAIVRDSDRAAPLGTGNVKVGGNYASSLKSIVKVQALGYSSPMYLDAKEKKYIDEIGAANFFGIKNNTYITPKSESILPSITNMSLMVLAEDLGMKVERRPVPLEELETFEEVGACGTAAVISPINEIMDMDHNRAYKFCKDGKPGPLSHKLYNILISIQHGEVEDKFKWTELIEF